MDIVFRAIALYVFIYVLIRKTGRRTIADLAPFDFVLLIILGDAVQQGLTQDDFSVTGAIIAVSTIVTLQVFTTYLSFRLPWFKRAVEGEPIVLVQDGELIERNLRRERLTVGDLMEQARLEHIASLDTVQWAVLEQNGKVSFILNEPKESV